MAGNFLHGQTQANDTLERESIPKKKLTAQYEGVCGALGVAQARRARRTPAPYGGWGLGLDDFNTPLTGEHS